MDADCKETMTVAERLMLHVSFINCLLLEGMTDAERIYAYVD